MGVGIYCRISSDPNEKEEGVRRQEADCRELAERHAPGEDVAVYVDNDVSASQPMENRPAFMRMLTDAQEGLISTIVAWRDDRLWRSVEHKGQVFAIARDSGVKHLITMDQAYDPENIGDQLISTMKAAVAEYEAASIKLRVNRALKERAVEGKPHGGTRPFGYEKDRLTVNEAEAELFREAVARVLDGEPTSRICDDWNRRDVPTVNNGIWRPRTLRGMLTNPRYIGKCVYRGVPVSDAQWPAIITELQHKRLERLFSTRVRGPNADKHLLSGILQCADCNDLLATGYTRRRRLYRTHKQTARVESCGVHLSISAEPVEQLIREAIIERLSKGVPVPVAASNDDALTDELQIVQRKMQEVNEMYMANELSRQERAEMRAHLKKRENALQAAAIKQAAPSLPDDTPYDRAALEEAWDERGVTWQRSLIKALIAKIEVSPMVTTRDCAWCGSDISHRSRVAMYCSQTCNNAAYEERKRTGKSADHVSQRLNPVWIC